MKDKYYENIKELLINNEVYKRVKDYSKNKSEIETYYNVGKLIIEAQSGEIRAKYGTNLIKKYSEKLIKELNDKKYSYRNLMNMRKFYLVFRNEKVNALRSQLTWSHYRELLSLKEIDEIKYYINIAVNYNLGYRELACRIKSKEYERLPIETRDKLVKNEEVEIKDLVPNPIIIRNDKNVDVVNEMILHNLILENMKDFLKELGPGYTFMDSEYKIKIGDRYNYIDLLLFNIEFNCYVVVELKVTELKKEYVGQIEIYMNYIDKHVKKINHDNTMGIIVCKKDNKYVINYITNKRIISREYVLI